MLVTLANRFDMPKNAETAAMSQMSSSVKPCFFKAYGNGAALASAQEAALAKWRAPIKASGLTLD